MDVWPTGKGFSQVSANSWDLHLRIFRNIFQVHLSYTELTKENDELFYANNEFLHMSGYKDMDELFRLTKKSFRNLIREDEQQQIESSIWEQIDSGNENDYIHFHLRKADGTYLSVLDHGRIVDSQQYGRVFYVLFMDWEDMHIRYNKILKEKMKDKNAYIK